MKKLIVFLLLVVVFQICLLANEVKIVNGEETTKEEWEERFSGVVMLITEFPEGISSCTATLIDPQVLLTAHHCVGYDNGYGGYDYIEPSAISVKSGVWCGYTSITIAMGKEIVVHEDADIALIYLNKKIGGHIIYPVRDYPEETIGEKGVGVGYGVTRADKQDSGTQRWGESTVLGVWSNEGIIELGDPSGFCYGDSGGPFFTTQNGKNVVSGVTSFGSGNDCYADKDSYSVQVVKYRDWIEANMEELTGHDLDNICGDGDIDEGETCEVGDERDCAEFGSYIPEIFAKCNLTCDGYDISVCEDQICGNYRKEGAEECDDGNEEDGDYCSADCTEITGKCGDNVVQTNEECDDGNIVSGDGCDLVCKNECGNGLTDKNEECDDGNLISEDGCDQNCKLECGNGMLNIGEQCDDGNLVSGDGCNASCIKEPDKETGCSVVVF